MKKSEIFLIAAIISSTFLFGCKEEKEEVKKDKNNIIAVSEDVSSNVEQKQFKDEVIEKDQNNESSKDENSKASEKNDQNADSTDKDNTESENNSTDYENTTETNFGSYSNDNESITEIAVKLHEKSCETQWRYLFGCPYELDYDDTSGEAIRIIGVNSISEIINEYCQVFSSASSTLNEKYFEEDGKLYCYDGGRGADIYYKGTELILVSSDENSALFTAVSHYADPETGEPMDSKSYDFKMVKDGEVWKTSDFTLPY